SVYINEIHSFFFFQAEDGIRDLIVTGVQTCALPISLDPAARLRGELLEHGARVADDRDVGRPVVAELARVHVDLDDLEVRGEPRSEERRVGKECGSRRSMDSYVNLHNTSTSKIITEY